MDTLTRGSFTVEPRFYVNPADLFTGWHDVEYRFGNGLAVAELQDGSSTGYMKDGYWVWGVKVLEGERGHGLGSALMAGIVDHADREGRWMSLDCDPRRSGEWIVSFYEKFGFSVRRENDGIFLMNRPISA